MILQEPINQTAETIHAPTGDGNFLVSVTRLLVLVTLYTSQGDENISLPAPL